MGDISQVHVLIGDALFNGNSVAGGILLVIVLLLLVTFPMIIFKVQIQLLLIIDFLIIALATAIGWLDSYIFITLMFVIALIVASKMTGIMTGGSNGN
jgi:hypothetical protein